MNVVHINKALYCESPKPYNNLLAIFPLDTTKLFPRGQKKNLFVLCPCSALNAFVMVNMNEIGTWKPLLWPHLHDSIINLFTYPNWGCWSQSTGAALIQRVMSLDQGPNRGSVAVLELLSNNPDP